MISGLLDFFKYGNRKIYQFSPVRSGSTLVFNILQDIFIKHKIIKSHKIAPGIVDKYPVIITYRHPLDSLASTFMALDLELTDKELRKQVKRHKERGLDDLMVLFEHSQVLKFRYEDFYNNLDIIFSGLESFFEVSIDQAMREKLISKYHLETIKMKTKAYKDFSEFDKKSHWHGKHISENKGEPGYHLTFFSKEQIRFLNSEFSQYLSSFGYGPK